jgi:hypothetical protein
LTLSGGLALHRGAMRITRFWARGFRSLCDVTLDNLGPFVVLYGPNGSGKSNVLAAIDTFFRLAPIAAAAAPQVVTASARGAMLHVQQLSAVAGQAAAAALSVHDWYGQIATHAMVLGAQLEFAPLDPLAPPESLRLGSALQVEVTYTLRGPNDPALTITRWSGAESDGDGVTTVSEGAALWFCNVLAPAAFALVDPIRAMPDEREPTKVDAGVVDPVLDEVRRGNLKTALFNAKNSSDGATLERFEAMRRVMVTALQRPVFQVARDARTRVIDLYEQLPPPNPEHKMVPLHRAGLGVVQLYAIVATLLFARRATVAIEEPEAHLHAPTTGRQLRALLSSLLSPTAPGQRPLLDQLFVATHSNLFDLDPDGYWDVAMVDGETRVSRMALEAVDARHLYEPGPAKHILQKMLRRYGNETVFRTASGERVDASRMIEALQRDEDIAVEFLRTLHETALETMAMRAQDDAEGE